MSTSTDAVLFYGTHWPGAEDEALPPGVAEEPSWEDKVAAAAGLVEPAVRFPDRRVEPTQANGYSSTPTDWTPEEQAAIDARRAWWKVTRQAVEASGCLVDQHCSGDYPMPFVAIKASMVTASRGDVQTVSSLEVDPVWDDQLRAFLAAIGAEPGEEFGWYLVSWWS